MQVLQDSGGVRKDSINPDTFLWSRATAVDTMVKTTAQSAKSIFIDIYHGHELKPRHSESQPVVHEGGNWLFIVVLLVVAVFAYLRVAYRKYLDQLTKAFFNMNMTYQIVRDENILVQRASLMLNIIFYAAAALLVYFISVEYNWSMKGMGIEFKRFLFIAMIVAGVYFAKLLFLRIGGSIFNVDREMSTYIFNIFLINNMLGLALMPVLVLFVFFGFMQLKWLLTVGIILAACAFIYRIFRGVVLSIASSFASFTYLFLYICALEIAPLLVFVKLISEQ